MIAEAVNQLHVIGVRLWIDGDTVKYSFPVTVKQKHPEVYELLNQLKANKPEALQILKQQEAAPQKKAWIEPEVKPVRAILLWSEKLQDHFWWLVEESLLPEIQKDGVPIYNNGEIDILLNAPNEEARQMLHKFKRIFPGAKIYKT